ncbi:MAG: hypothetical protein M1834_003031 [Cirrosporium novae-zelandiae]|nr:MAG: hypothetical protein M1834_003031 [Cirrosporium novae-zelandiae]
MDSFRNVTPSSALLQDLLREKKSRVATSRPSSSSSRTNKTIPRVFSMPLTDDREVQSSPIESRRGSMTGLSKPKEMGAREMDAYVARLNNQNFDLKLEIYHRRKQSALLEDQLRKLKDIETQKEELQHLNQELMQQLEKRDNAVQEAVDIICELEDRIEDLEIELSRSRTPGHDIDNTTLATEPPRTPSRLPPSSPPLPLLNPKLCSSPIDVPSRTSSRRAVEFSVSKLTGSESRRTLSRTPSFLKSKASESSALRSLYFTDANKSKGNFSLLSRADSTFSRDDEGGEPDTFTLDSPRLSVLSESSFLSVYGKDPNRFALDVRVDHTPVETPVKSPEEHHNSSEELASTKERERMHKERMDWWIKSQGPALKQNKLMPPIEDFTRPRSLQDTRRSNSGPYENNLKNRDADSVGQSMRKDYRPVSTPRNEELSFHGPMFGKNILPPTPDTMSTNNQDNIHSRPSSYNDASISGGIRISPESLGPPIEHSRKGTGEAIGPVTEAPETIHPKRSHHKTTDHSPASNPESVLNWPVRPRTSKPGKVTSLLAPGSPSRSRLSCYGGDLLVNGDPPRSPRPSSLSPSRCDSPRSSSPQKVSWSPHKHPSQPNTPHSGDESFDWNNSTGNSPLRSQTPDHVSTRGPSSPFYLRVHRDHDAQFDLPVRRPSLANRIFRRGSSHLKDLEKSSLPPRPETSASDYATKTRRLSAIFGQKG